MKYLKYIILLLSIVLVSTFYFEKQKNKSSFVSDTLGINETKKAYTIKDIQKESLTSERQKNNFYSEFASASFSSTNFYHQLNQRSIEDVFSNSQKVFHTFLKCFFSVVDCPKKIKNYKLNKSQAKAVIYKNLEAMDYALNKNPDLEKLLDKKILFKSLDIEAKGSQRIALGFLSRLDLAKQEYYYLIDKTKKLNGQTAAMSFLSLSQSMNRNNIDNNNYFITSVLNVLANTDDLKRLVSTSKILHKMSLSKNEFFLAVEQICSIKEQARGQDLWPNLRATLLRQKEQLNFQNDYRGSCLKS